MSRKIFKKLDVARGADLIILVGNTGCGKSTLLRAVGEAASGEAFEVVITTCEKPVSLIGVPFLSY